MPDCQSADGNSAVFVGTMLATGDGFTLCDECLAMWAIALASRMTGVDPAPFIHALSVDDEPVPTPPTNKAGRSRAKSSAPPMAVDGETETETAEAST